MSEYKITFRNGGTQTLATPGPRLEEGWLVFADGVGEQLRVWAEEVEYVIRVGTPERSDHSGPSS